MRFGEFLVKHQRITQAELNVILNQQKRQGGKLGEWLIESGVLDESVVYRWLAEFWRLPFFGIDQIQESLSPVLPRELSMIPWEELKSACLGMHRVRGKARLVLVTSNPFNLDLQKKIEFLCGCSTFVIVASPSDIREFHLQQNLGRNRDTSHQESLR